MPKVSIITAAYNHVKFVRQSVESAQAQTYRDFEHIVIDDGSSDGTAEILQSFGDKITYIRQENCGAHAAINRGIRMSSGEFIAILDSDDAWLPHKLERQMQMFEQFPEAGLVYSYASMIDADGGVNGEQIGEPLSDSRHPFEELLRGNRVPILAAVFRRACIEDVGFFSETLKAFSDWDLLLRISVRWSFIFVPEPLALYRVHDNNSWKRLLESGLLDKERLIVLENAAALMGTGAEWNHSKDILKSVFRETALKTAYGHWYRHRYVIAQAYFLFALRVQPNLLKDAIFAIRPRLIARLLIGESGIRAFSSMKRLLS